MTATETARVETAAGRQPLMTLDGVSQVFDTKAGQIRAVETCRLSINPGEVLCLVGESGSGQDHRRADGGRPGPAQRRPGRLRRDGHRFDEAA